MLRHHIVRTGILGLLLVLPFLAVDSSAEAAPVAGSSPVAAPQGAAGDTSPPCHGYVYKLNKANGRAHLKYWIYCDRKVDKIVLTSYLRHRDRWARKGRVVCEDTWVCEQKRQLKDRPGKQLYIGGASEGTFPPASYVEDNGRTWNCVHGKPHNDNYMRCAPKKRRL